MKKKLIQIICMLIVLATLASCTIAIAPPSNGDDNGNTDNPGGNTDNPGGNTDNPGGNTDNPGTGDNEDKEDESALGFTVVINEVCTKTTTDTDPTDNANYDWIELYNKGDEDFVLTGYAISDRADNIKHIFDSTVVVPAKGFLVLYACGSENMASKSETGIYLPFSLSKNGESVYLFSKRGTILDSLDVPALKKNTSYGYITDGTGSLAKLTTTKGATNATADVLTLSDSVVAFSKEAGFYDEAFTLTLDLPEGYKAYYTLDCTEPNTDSQEFPAEGLLISDASVNANKYASLYTGYMEIVMYVSYSKVYGFAQDLVDKCTVLQVVVYDNTGKSTNVITKNYFVGTQFGEKDYEDISVVCLTGDPDSLFGTDGLFTNQTYASTGSKVEREVNFSYFSAKQNYKFDQTIGIRLHGTSTPKYNQKSLTLFARDRYGNDAFEQAVVGKANTLHSMVLRTDGTTKLQEGFLTSFISETSVETAEYKPCIVFIDGEYYGVFNLYERIDDDYFEENYGVDADNVWIVKKGQESNVPEALTEWTTVYKWMCSTNVTSTTNWNKLNSLVDVQSLIDLIAAETYLCNADWSIGRSATSPAAQNYACWRVIDKTLEDPNNKYGDGRWRFIIYDMDISAGAYKAAENRSGASSAVLNYNCTPDYNGFTTNMIWAGTALTGMPVWTSLIKNETFKKMFAITFQDMCQLYYRNAGDAIEKEIVRYSKWMENQFDRFGVPVTAWEAGSSQSGTSDAQWKPKTFYGGHSERPTHVTAEDYIYEMQRMQNFFNGHSYYAMEDLGEVLGLTANIFDLEIYCDSAKGTVKINRVELPIAEDDDYYQVSYYGDYALTVSVEAKEGYEFTGWKVTSTATISSTTDSTITIKLNGSSALTATFAKIAE